MNDFIKAQGISFSYHVEEGQQPVSVFEDLDVTIHEGKTGIATDGRSPASDAGCGKRPPPEGSRQRNNILDMLSGIRKRWKRNMCFLRNNA